LYSSIVLVQRSFMWAPRGLLRIGGGERALDLIDEVRPGGRTAVFPQAVIPILGSVLHVEGHVPDTFLVRCAVGMEELLRRRSRMRDGGLGVSDFLGALLWSEVPEVIFSDRRWLTATERQL
jgi:hypothetical protein